MKSNDYTLFQPLSSDFYLVVNQIPLAGSLLDFSKQYFTFYCVTTHFEDQFFWHFVSFYAINRRQAECAKTARIQMALPTGKPGGGAANNLYEELGDNAM